jgi:hypothetical protein
VLCTVGAPPVSGLAVAPGAGALEATGSAGLPALLPVTGADPPEMVVKALADSGPLTVADDTEAGTPVLGTDVFAAVLLVGAKVAGGVLLKRLLLLWQQSQPTRAIPAQAAPIRLIKGFLPIGNPFPRRNEPRARQPLRGREVGAVTRIQSSPVID